MAECPACGQTLPPPYPEIAMSQGQRRILELVHRAGKYGIASDVLFDRLYADDEEGGPLGGRGVLQVRIYLLNRKLKQIGKVIRAPKGGRNGGPTNYTLRDV